MSLDKIKIVSEQILERLPAVIGRGEEATKQALVLPMLDALGFDIWSPAEVCPEYEADFAIKKAGQKEKVDIAILLDGAPRIFLEVKQVECLLDGHEGQLARYFNSTSTVTLSILTNGIEWRFFTDTSNPNVMDSQPFHVVNLKATDQNLDIMARFSKSSFLHDSIRNFATELLYTANIAAFLRSEIDLRDKEPSEYLIRWILKSENMYDGVVNQNVVERFRPIVKAGITRVIREVVRRSVAALDIEAARNNSKEQDDSVDQSTSSTTRVESEKRQPQTINQGDEIDDSAAEASSSSEKTKAAIITTENELNLFAIAEGLFDQSSFVTTLVYDSSMRKEVPITLGYKDTTGYFGIYINKPAWWVLRAVTESKKPWIGFNLPMEVGERLLPATLQQLDPSPYAEFRVAIASYEDLVKLEDIFIAALDQAVKNRTPSK